MLDSATLAATLALAIALTVAGVGFGLLDPPAGRSGHHADTPSAASSEPVPGAGPRAPIPIDRRWSMAP
jgi:hypothetical protein